MKENKPFPKKLVSVIIFASICWLSVFTFSRLFFPIPKVCTKEQRGDQNLLDISQVEPIENEIHTVGHLGGKASSIFMSGHYVFAKLGLELAAFDTSDPTKLNRVDYLLIPGDLIHIDQAGQYAIIHHKGLWKVDISDPTNMSATHISSPQGHIESIKIINNRAFITTVHCEYISIGFGIQIKTGCRNALHVVNISNPEGSTRCIGGVLSNIIRLLFLGLNQELINNLQKSDEANGFFYTVSEQGGLQTFDVPPPLQTTAIASYSPPFELVDVLIYNSNAFITRLSHDFPYTWWDLHAIDVSDPENPTDLGNVSSHSVFVAVVDNFGFVSADGRTSEMKVLDLQNPFSNEEIMLSPNLAEITQMKNTNSYMFVNIQEHKTTRLPPGMFIEDELLYTFSDGINMKDISNFSSSNFSFPDQIGHYNLSTRESVVDLVVKNKIAYIADWAGTLEIADFSDPKNPRLISTYDAGSRINELKIVNNFLFAITGRDGLQIIDISNPKSPAQAGSYITGTYISGIFIKCPYIYITDIDNGFFVLQSDILTFGDCK